MFEKDRRKNERQNVGYIALIHSDAGDTYGDVHDISEEGIGLLLKRNLIVGKIFDLDIKEYGNNNKIIMKLRAQVIWHNYIDILGIYRIGMKILETSRNE